MLRDTIGAVMSIGLTIKKTLPSLLSTSTLSSVKIGVT